MISAVLICSGWLTMAPAIPAQADRDLASYEAAQATAGRDPAAQIKLALWCEAHGLQAERIKHLAIAVMTDPSNATARGLMGLVTYRGRWQRPEAVGKTVEADAELKAILERYHERRLKAPYTADGQWKLALWCEENGLKEQARAHLRVVTSLEPGRDSAWKRLGYKQVGNRWVKPEQIAAETAENTRQKQADRRWKPVLEHAREHLSDRGRQVETEEDLAQITDPRVVPMICRVFGKGEANQGVAVRLLGQIDAPQSSQALAIFAVGSPSAEVRRVATETLARRDPREFARWLADLLRKPIKYEVKPVRGPGLPGELFVEGTRFNLERLYSPPASSAIQPGDRVGFDGSGRPVVTRVIGYDRTVPMSWAQTQLSMSGGFDVDLARAPEIAAKIGLNADQSRRLQEVFRAAYSSRNNFLTTVGNGSLLVGGRYSVETERLAQIPVGEMALEAQVSARMAEQQLESDVAVLKKYNAPIVQRNERVLSILTKVTDADLGDDPETWKKWAVDLLGYAYVPMTASPERPTITEQVPLDVQPQATPIIGSGAQNVVRVGHSCFAGGTLVSTMAGSRPIESLRIGDQLLAQNTTTGGLSYQPIVAVYHNPPNHTLRIDFGGESIVATGIHRFWKAGRGWTMARDLKVGDVVRTVDGLARVEAVESDSDQPVFNLQAAEGQSFFVGKTGALVHDNSLVETVSEPFDAAPELDAVVRND